MRNDPAAAPRGRPRTPPAPRLAGAARVGFRFTKIHRSSALHFGTGKFRWNAPEGEYGVLYVADSVDGAFAETLGHDLASVHVPAGLKILDEADLAAYRVWEIVPRRALRVACFHGHGLARLSLDGEICTCTDYTAPRAWSQWVHDGPADLDGLMYHSRHYPPSACFALFDRCRDDLVERDLGLLADWREGSRDIYDVLDAFGWSLR